MSLSRVFLITVVGSLLLVSGLTVYQRLQLNARNARRILDINNLFLAANLYETEGCHLPGWGEVYQAEEAMVTRVDRETATNPRSGGWLVAGRIRGLPAEFFDFSDYFDRLPTDPASGRRDKLSNRVLGYIYLTDAQGGYAFAALLENQDRVYAQGRVSIEIGLELFPEYSGRVAGSSAGD